MKKVTSIEDLRALHKKRTPKTFYDYMDSGSWSESTYQNNTNAFDSYKFRQPVLVDIDNRNLKTTMLGHEVSICSIKDVADAVNHPFLLHLCAMHDRDFIKRLILRAKAAGCSVLVLIVDLQIMGQRHKDIKNGLSTPPKFTAKTMRLEIIKKELDLTIGFCGINDINAISRINIL